MHRPPPTVATFLGLVHRQVMRLGTREYLAAERLLRERGEHWSHGELRAAIASVLARSPEQWQQVAQLYDELVAGGTPGEEWRQPVPQQPVVVHLARPPSGLRRLLERLRTVRDRLVEKLRNAPRPLWLGAVVIVVAVVVTSLLGLLSQPPVAEKVEVTSVESPERVATAAESEFLILPVSSLSQGPGQMTEMVEPPAAGWNLLAAIVMVSVVLLALGCRFALLPAAVRAAGNARTRRTDQERRQLEEQQAAAGVALSVQYRLDRHLPVSRTAVLDSAELLGRLYREEHGVDLDAEATLDRTVAAAGRFSPVAAPRFSRQEALLLVDTEGGSHPWLDSFRRLQAAWVAQGIVFRCYEFTSSPAQLVEAETREALAFADLARRAEGLPLIIFSRRLAPSARLGEADWLRHLGAWQRRAWLDPDPCRPRELVPGRRQELRRLARLGLPRFHLGDEGVVLLARWLAAGGEGTTEAGEPPLPPLPPWAAAGCGELLAEALRRWALVAALVPDPTWDQLEAIRRHFPEIHGVLDEPRYLQRLLEWIERETGQPAEGRGGQVLEIPESCQDDLLREQRQLEREVSGEQGFEERARRLLLDQLSSTRPDDPLQRQWWEFKRAMHRAVLEPERAAKLLAWISESPIAHEAGRWIRRELDRQANGVGTSFSVADTERLRECGDHLRGISLRALLLEHRGVLLRPALLAVCGGLALLAGLVATAGSISRRCAVEVGRPIRTTPVYALLEMVTIPGGTFEMGSERGDPDERPVHTVKVAALQMAKTEVTVGQYRLCVEAQACTEPETGGACNWGREDRDEHPVNCVSWEDARRFAEWARAGLRLPTEAEWEYAARSDGLEREYPWGDEPPDCDRAAVATCGLPGTLPVCSKTAGNTEQGLCDMAGNVWEWVEDQWHDSYRNAPQNGYPAWIDKTRVSVRVIRGGSWGFGSRGARCALRDGGAPSYRSSNLGFRVARPLPSATGEFPPVLQAGIGGEVLAAGSAGAASRSGPLCPGSDQTPVPCSGPGGIMLPSQPGAEPARPGGGALGVAAGPSSRSRR